MRVLSLFSGVGGLELGLEWAGVGHTVAQVEKDPYCRAVLAKHWPNATRYDDVCTVGAHNLEPVDVICGGFPCQDISYAGKGAGLAGHRSGLWYEFARIVGEMEPRFVVVENVAALLTRGIDQVLGTLADLGYDAEWSTLRASDVGAPHRRERVFLIAWMADAASERNGGRAGEARRRWSDQRLPAMGDPSRRGRRTGAGLDVRRAERGCDDVGYPEGERRAGRQDDAYGGRRERASGHSDANMEHPSRGGRRTGAGLDVRRAERGCDDVEHTTDDIRREYAGGQSGTESESRREAQERAVCEGVRLASDERPAIGCDGVGDADSERGRGGRVGQDARDVGAPGQMVRGWEDATPVRGADGTVRLIPAEALAANGIKSYFRGVVDGASLWMDNASVDELDEAITRYGKTAGTSPAEVLRTLWGAVVSAPLQWHPGRKVAVLEEALLFTLLREYARRSGGETLAHEGPTLDGGQDDFLRSLRELRSGAYPSRQPQPDGQPTGKSPAALQVVSSVLAQAARASWARYVNAGAAVLPRWPVVGDCPGRVAKLRALGNAVVPQCAYIVGRRLLEIDAALRAERAA